MTDAPLAPQGRLELTWTNKHLRLLAHEDGGYEWSQPGDYRVAEVRLLDNAATVGECADDANRARDNLLVRGDALNALTSLTELPEFAKQYLGKVKCAYIDPPFNTGQAFAQYDDNLEHSVWCTMLRDRLLQIKKLLRPDGSVWVHCNDDEQHRLRCVLDEVFGTKAFIASVVWQGRYSRDSRPAIGPVHHFIHVYAPLGAAWKEVRNRVHRGDLKWRNPDNDPGGPWVDEPFQAQAGRATINQFYGVRLPNGTYMGPPEGRAWSSPQHRYEQMRAENQYRFWFGTKGDKRPRIKRYQALDEKQGLVPWTWWPHDEVGHSEEAFDEVKALVPDTPVFATPKPERLLERVLSIATDPGDIVLDCFLGSATTAAVAHKMQRRWVGVEARAETIETYGMPRLQQVVEGADPGGVTHMTDWKGGGGFRVLDVAPSMFSEVEGSVYLADWATNGRLAEACAAQLHFEVEFDPPFAGRRGRARLAVVDGLVNEDAARLLLNMLDDDESLTVCGTAVDPAVRGLLRELRPGSTVRKIPQAILDDYREARWRPRGAPTTADTNGAAPTTTPAGTGATS